MPTLAPSDMMEVHYVHGGGAVTTGVTDIDDAERIYVGRYAYVTLMVLTNNITAGTGGNEVVVTPIFGETQAAAGVRLDGTGGQPDKRIIFDDSTTYDFKCFVREFYVAGLPGHYMNVEVNEPSLQQFAADVLVLGFYTQASAARQSLVGSPAAELKLA